MEAPVIQSSFHTMSILVNRIRKICCVHDCFLVVQSVKTLTRNTKGSSQDFKTT